METVTPIAPRLPTATFEYERVFQDQFENILRLYFSQLDNNNTQVNQAVNSNTTLIWLGA